MNNVPNFDGMDVDALAWWRTQRNNAYGVRAWAEEWFPNRPRGFVRVTREILTYAHWKLAAMESRARGEVQAALVFEEVCGDIYKALPEWARW